MKSILPSLLLAVIAISFILVWELAPPSKGVVIAVFPPGDEVEDLGARLKRANATLIDTSSVPGGFLVSSQLSGLPARLREQGAILVLKAYPSLGCAPPDAATTYPKSAFTRETS